MAAADPCLQPEPQPPNPELSIIYLDSIHRGVSDPKYGTGTDLTAGLPNLNVGHLVTFWLAGFAHTEVEALEEEVKEKCGILCQLTDELNAVVLKTIKAVMRDRNLLEELSGKASNTKTVMCYQHTAVAQLTTSAPRMAEIDGFCGCIAKNPLQDLQLNPESSSPFSHRWKQSSMTPITVS